MTPDQLVIDHLYVAREAAEAISRKLPPCVDLDDLVSDATQGLMEAAKSFDPAKGNKFTTFAFRRVAGAIWDGIRKRDCIPRFMRSRMNRIEALMVQSTQRGEPLGEDEALEAIGLRGHPLQRFRYYQGVSRSFSLDRTFAVNFEGSEGREYSDHSAIPDNGPRPDEKATADDFWDAVTQGMNLVERMVIIFVYRDGMDQAEAAAAIGLSPSRVSLIHTNLLRRLRANKRIAELAA